MKENVVKNKMLIMNLHNDKLLNQWTYEYIKLACQQNKEIQVYLENIIYNKNDSNQSFEANEIGDESNHESDAFLEMTQKLFKLGVKTQGLKSKDTINHEEKKTLNNTSSGDLNSLIENLHITHKQHDEFMLDVIKKAQGPLIAVVGALHLIAWLFKEEISAEDYNIILPNHTKILDNLKTDEYNVLEIYNQILDLDGIAVVDIDLVML